MKVDRIFKHKPGATIEEVLQYRGQFYEKVYDYRLNTSLTHTVILDKS